MLGLQYSRLLFSPILFPPVLPDRAYRVPAPSFTWWSAFAQFPVVHLRGRGFGEVGDIGENEV